jgi:ubiquinone/menaquinone biosynthesis C-methylase UbiE
MTLHSENDFDSLAHLYDRLGFVVFGDTILQAQRALLSQVPAQATVLFIGGGSGRVLPQLLAQNPKEIWYVEKSAKMLALARQQVPADDRIRWIHGDEAHPAVSSQQFDVILTFFLLDLFEESSLQALMRRLSQRLRPGGKWLVADFNPAANGVVSRLLYRSMYGFFRLTSRVQASHLPNYPVYFDKIGLTLKDKKLFYRRIIQSLLYEKERTDDQIHT